MALFVVATPIGNNADFTLRALDLLRAADLIIGEELKVLRQTLKAAGVSGKPLDQLNEHSRAADFAHLAEQCRERNVVLISDCGTPGFCDPGADLVKACRDRGIPVHPVPGASSLMALLSVCGERLDTFVFAGFIPAKREAREKAWREWRREPRPIILMETPYRASSLLKDLAEFVPNRRCVLGLDLTAENERVLNGRGQELLKQAGAVDSAEPIVLILPERPS